jgi:cell division protein FtsB
MVEDIGEKKEKKLDDLRSENEGLKIEVAKLNQDSQSKNTQWNQQVSQLEGNAFISKL